MIVVRVELWSAITGAKTEIARMQIYNDGTGSATRGNYDGVTFRGRGSVQLNRCVRSHSGRVEGYARQARHIWNLVAIMLRAMEYGQ